MLTGFSDIKQSLSDLAGDLVADRKPLSQERERRFNFFLCLLFLKLCQVFEENTTVRIVSISLWLYFYRPLTLERAEIFQNYIKIKRFLYPIVLPFHLFSLFFPINSLLCFDFSANTTLEEYLISDGIVLNLDSLIAVAMDLISAIQHLEQKGVVHNNITTSSVLIGKGFRVS